MLWLAFKTKTIMWDRSIVITSANLPTHRSLRSLLRRQSTCQTSQHMAQRGVLATALSTKPAKATSLRWWPKKPITAKKRRWKAAAKLGWVSLVSPNQCHAQCGQWCQMARHGGGGCHHKRGWQWSSRARRCVQNTKHKPLLIEHRLLVSLFRVHSLGVLASSHSAPFLPAFRSWWPVSFSLRALQT